MELLSGAEFQSPNFNHYFLLKNIVLEYFLVTEKHIEKNSKHVLETEHIKSQKLGQEFYEKEHTKPLFNKHEQCKIFIVIIC